MNTTETNQHPDDGGDLYSLQIPTHTAWALAMGGPESKYEGHALSDDERKVLATIVLGSVLTQGPKHILSGIRSSLKAKWPGIQWDEVEADILRTHSTQ